MRAAALSTESSPFEIVALKGGGMHAAYAFIKDKSRWIGPNMSSVLFSFYELSVLIFFSFTIFCSDSFISYSTTSEPLIPA
jgi:hypothetical protein